jgi:hypothetical protein
VLLVSNPAAEHALLPNVVVDPGEDWATAARTRVEGITGIDPTPEGVELVRRVEHAADGESVGTTHHVLFVTSAPDDRVPDGLCADNDWELCLYDVVPYASEDGDDAEAGEDGGAVAHVRRFLGGGA